MFALKCHYKTTGWNVISIGYCNYEVGGNLQQAVITEIPMELDGKTNKNRKDLKWDNAASKIKVEDKE